LFLYFIAILKKQNEKKSETGFCSETDFSNQDRKKKEKKKLKKKVVFLERKIFNFLEIIILKFF
jgi:hypothetical protein